MTTIEKANKLYEEGLKAFRLGDTVRCIAPTNQPLEIIKSEHPDLVFLDVMMPIINGFDVCQKVKGKLGLEMIYIAMLTAKGQEIDKQRGREVGADVCITKPFDPDKILEITDEVLSKSSKNADR